MNRTGMEVAIIGVAGRFPKSQNVEAFWNNLLEGKDCITHFSKQELLEGSIDKSLVNDPNYVPARGYLEGIENFDANYFDLSSQDVMFMDPQVRLFIELVNEAFENAAINPQKLKSSVGLYGGAIDNFDWKLKAQFQPKDNIDAFSAGINSTKDLMTTLTSYLFDLKGPSFSIQTACSTSMVAVHTACRSVLSGECDMALAGGVSVSPYQNTGHLHSEGMFFSPDGKIRPFDENAGGFVFGYGGGVVMLKSLEEAIEDGDHIHGVIRSSAINNDGKQKVGYAAPSVQGQTRVIEDALELAEINKSQIRYLETHGAATPLGDSVEIRALNNVFGKETPGTIGVGSVKSNVGHLDAAAGMAGLIKTLMLLKNKTIPPTINFDIPNDNLGLINSPFFIPNEPTSLEDDSFPRYAGVSSMGIGGTNVHVVLEEYEQDAPPSTSEKEHLVVLSAKTSTALKKQKEQLLDYLNNHPEVDLEQLAYSLQVGRKELKFRQAWVVKTSSALHQQVDLTEDGIKVKQAFDSEFWDLSEIQDRHTNFSDYLKSLLYLAQALNKKGLNPGRIRGTIPEAAIWKVVENAQKQQKLHQAFQQNGDVAQAIQNLFPEVVWSENEELAVYDVESLKKLESKQDSGIQLTSTDQLTVLGTLWSHGCGLNWDQLYAGAKPKRIPLPTYPFERKRYWIEYDPHQMVNQGWNRELKKADDITDWFYLPTWARVPGPAGLSIDTEQEYWLVLANNTEQAQSFLEQCAIREINIELCFSGQAIADVLTTIDAQKLTRVISFWSLEIPDFQPDEITFGKGYDATIELVQALQTAQVMHHLKIHWITGSLFEVLGGELINPQQNAILGPLRSIPQEHVNLFCQAIDLDAGNHTNQVDFLFRELQQTKPAPQVALRGKGRWEMTYQKITSEGAEPLFEKGGNYIITGGLGNIGFTIAEHLLKAYQANVWLLSRTGLPPEEEWNQILTEPKGSLNQLRLQRFSQLKAVGNIQALAIDVTDEADISKLFKSLSTQFGKIHGLIHAAGSIGENSFMPVVETSPLGIHSANYQAKIAGTIALWKAVQSHEVGFCLLMSSISSALGGLGFSEYAATSHFLESFCHWSNQQSSNTNWMSIGWDSWPVLGGKEASDALVDKLRMSAEESFQVLDLLPARLWDDFTVIHSPADLNQRVEQWIELHDQNSAVHELARSPRPEIDTDFVAPQTDEEKAIAGIWRDVLGLEEIGLDDDFFDLGGNSLKMIAIASNIHKKLKKQVEIKTLFDLLTIRQVAAYLSEVNQTSGLEEIKPAVEAEHYPMTPAMANVYMLSQFKNIDVVYNIANGLRLTGQVDVDRIRQCAQELVDRHEILRTSFINVDGEPRQRINQGVKLSFEHIVLKEGQNVREAISSIILPFDLGGDSMFRTGLIQIAPDDQVLVFDLHHILCDGVTISALADEFTQLYQGASLPAPKVQFKDYAVYLNETRKTEAEPFWKEQLKTPLPLLDFPTDFERGTIQDFAGKRHIFEMEDGLLQQLNQVAGDASVTRYIQLISLLYALLSRYSRQSDIIIGSGVAGRNHPDVQKSIGLFFNEFPVRIQSSVHTTFRQLLHQVKALMMDIWAHENCDMENVYEKLKIERQAKRGFLYEVVFLLQNYQASGVQMEETQVSHYELPVEHAQNDITFHAYEMAKGLKWVFTYRTSLYKTETIEQLGKNLMELANAVIQNPDVPLSTLEISDLYQQVTLDASDLDFEF